MNKVLSKKKQNTIAQLVGALPMHSSAQSSSIALKAATAFFLAISVKLPLNAAYHTPL
jgi:hypothetical protein